MGDVWWQGVNPLAEHLQDFDFGMFLGRVEGHDLYDSYLFIYLVSFLYSVIYLFVISDLSCFAFIPSHRRRPEDTFKRL